MTADQVAKALDLQPFDSFEYYALLKLAERSKTLKHEDAIAQRFRQTGRTTRILCAAVARMTGNVPVYVMGSTKHATAELQGKLRSMMRRLEVPMEMLQMTEPIPMVCWVMKDHSPYERD